ncbi:hypothetical protein V2J09_021196, partial [Rumex salicifolius]
VRPLLVRVRSASRSHELLAIVRGEAASPPRSELLEACRRRLPHCLSKSPELLCVGRPLLRRGEEEGESSSLV